MTANSNGKVTIIAEKKIGRFAPKDEITIEKYAARVLVALGKAKFKNEADEFRRHSSPKKRSRRTYARRDMVAE